MLTISFTAWRAKQSLNGDVDGALEFVVWKRKSPQRPLGSGIGSSNSRAQPSLMTPTLLVELGFEASRQPRRFVPFGHVAPRTRRASSTAGAGVFAFPWAIGYGILLPLGITINLPDAPRELTKPPVLKQIFLWQ
jgi:hypothetical protein